MPDQVSIIYRASHVLPMTDAGPSENAEVWVEDGRVRQVGQGIAAAHPNVGVRDLGRAALLPGFVNAHSHVEYTFSRGPRDGMSFWDWIESVGFRRDRTPPRELLAASARLGAALCAFSGVTCFGDCSYSGVAAEAIDALGARGVVFKELFGQSMGSDYPARVRSVLDEAQALRSRVSERVCIGISPHAVYTTNSDVFKLCAESCAELNMPVGVHVAETDAEAQYTVGGIGPIADLRRKQGYEPLITGLRPLGVLESAGLLREGTILAHCVDLTDDEIGLIAASGASVAHCPRSNAYLGAGVMRLGQMRQAGVRVGLGTDSAASCLTLDFFEEMRFAVGLHRASAKDAGALLAKDVLKLATAGGAEALGLGDQIGRLEAGMRADMIAVDLAAMLPGEDIHLAALSRTPADVKLRLVDGVEIEPGVEGSEAQLRELMEHQTRE
jgi:cytosine/adenosine deaminase-related metal-dependent hydrolase